MVAQQVPAAARVAAVSGGDLQCASAARDGHSQPQPPRELKPPLPTINAIQTRSSCRYLQLRLLNGEEAYDLPKLWLLLQTL